MEKRVVITPESEVFHLLVEELVVSDGCCNDEDLKEVDLSVFVNLKELRVEP